LEKALPPGPANRRILGFFVRTLEVVTLEFWCKRLRLGRGIDAVILLLDYGRLKTHLQVN